MLGKKAIIDFDIGVIAAVEVILKCLDIWDTVSIFLNVFIRKCKKKNSCTGNLMINIFKTYYVGKLTNLVFMSTHKVQLRCQQLGSEWLYFCPWASKNRRMSQILQFRSFRERFLECLQLTTNFLHKQNFPKLEHAMETKLKRKIIGCELKSSSLISRKQKIKLYEHRPTASGRFTAVREKNFTEISTEELLGRKVYSWVGP